MANLAEAARRLRDSEGIDELRVSPLYRTDPVGKIDQDWFVNAVAVVETELSPHALLELCLSIETALHRVRSERWGPRTLDIDILLYGDLRIQEKGLVVPHPRLTERAFVLAPLSDLAPELEVSGLCVSDWLAQRSEQGVERIGELRC